MTAEHPAAHASAHPGVHPAEHPGVHPVGHPAAHPGVHPADAVRHLVHDAVDGSHVWGSVDRSPARSTVVQQVTLRVNRPGTTPADRRLLHVRQVWPAAGAVLAAVCLLVAIAAEVAPPVAALAAAAVWVAGAASLELGTRRVRGSVRELTASSTCTPSGLVVVGDAARVRATAARLVAVERDAAAGRITPARFEALRGEVWEALPAGPPAAAPR